MYHRYTQYIKADSMTRQSQCNQRLFDFVYRGCDQIIATSLYGQSLIKFMESTENALSNPKPTTVDPQDANRGSDSDSMPDNEEYSWEHPHKQWVVWLFEEM